MKKLIAAVLLFVCIKADAQTLFTYGNETVTTKEFLQAYNKNNTGKKDAKALQEYLDLYIASRLKIKEAKMRGYDTLPQIANDLQNLRAQILPAYLNDAESINKLVDEAFIRSQKDIHIAHIFVSIKNENGAIDSAAAKQKINEAYTKLQRNENFSAIAKQYSDDPSANENGGDIGFITVFSLPYELENLVYSLNPGKISSVYTSKAGYHIFKNLEERKALGRMKAAQILLAFPPGADEATKAATKKLADSLYNRLQKGDDFGKLAAEFSNDFVSAASNGQMPEFSVGQFDPVFEQAAFSLKKKGAFTKPFLTSHGYHIVQRISLNEPPSKKDEKEILALREKVEGSDRINTAKDALASRIVKQSGYTKRPFQINELWMYTDSLLDGKRSGTKISLQPKTSLFALGKADYTVQDWIAFAQVSRFRTDGSGLKPHTEVWDEFIKAAALEYYKANLELFNEDFKTQVREFSDGNLFFEIMQRQIWTPAQSDTTALINFYNQNKSQYAWQNSAEAVIFYANDAATAKEISDALKKSPAKWREVVSEFEEKVIADSGRFEIAQIPGAVNAKEGTITSPIINKEDNTTSFAYISKIYLQPEQRSFADAKGQVINDYQNYLEKKWVAALKEKYPVVINQKELAGLIKK